MLSTTPTPGVPAVLQSARWGDEFHAPEVENDTPFRWMGREARLSWDPADHTRFLVLSVKSHFDDLSQHLRATLGSQAPSAALALARGWSQISLEVAPGVSDVSLAADKLL